MSSNNPANLSLAERIRLSREKEERERRHQAQEALQRIQEQSSHASAPASAMSTVEQEFIMRLNDVSVVEREIDGLMERLEYGEDPEQILKHVEGDALLGRVLDEFSPATYARATEPVGARPYGATPAPLRGSARGNRRIRFESPRARRFLTPPQS